MTIRPSWSIILTVTALALLGRGAAAPAAAQSDTLQNLGTLGGTVTNVLGLNNLGQTVGASTTPAGVFRAFLSGAGKIIDLGTLGGETGIADAINDRGQVVGTSSLSGSSSYHAFLWQNDQRTDLGALADDISVAFDINEKGQVVGSSEAETGATHAVLWQNGQIRDLDSRAQLNSEATGINNLGQVAGTLQDESGNYHAFLWQDGKMTDLGTLGGSDSAAFDINDSGQVVGYSSLPEDAIQHAFLWENGHMTDLGTLGGLNSYAYSINNLGQVAGAAATALAVRHAFSWESAGTGMKDLNSQLAPGSGWELRLTEARLTGGRIRISDAGEIATDGEYRLQQLACLLSPPAGRSLSKEEASAVSQAMEQLRSAVERVGAGKQDGALLHLTSTLSAAQTRLTGGSTTMAVNLLEAFVRQVNALIEGGAGPLLARSDGQAWIDDAQAILAQLRQ